MGKLKAVRRCVIFISIVLLRIPTAVQPMTGIEGFKYQASDGLVSTSSSQWIFQLGETTVNK